MNNIATILIATAVLGAPTFSQDFPRSSEPSQARSPEPTEARTPASAATPHTSAGPGSTGRGTRALARATASASSTTTAG